MDVADDYEAYEPPPGPSGPVDLEAELFAFKAFPQLPLIQDELIGNPSRKLQLCICFDPTLGGII